MYKYKKTISGTEFGATYEIECDVCGNLAEYNSGNGCLVCISGEEEDRRIAARKCPICGSVGEPLVEDSIEDDFDE